MEQEIEENKINNQDIASKVEPYALTIVKLLQDVIYSDDKLWENLLNYQVIIMSYFEKIGLELIVDKADGYAFLKQVELNDDGKTIGLVKRMPMSYELSLLCVLLREWLDEFDIKDTDSRNLYVSQRDIRNRMELFFKEKTNQIKLVSRLDKYIKDACDLGFLKIVSESDKYDENNYEVKRIIKAKISNDILETFKRNLENATK